MSRIFIEETLLSDKDCLQIVERHKTEFNYPLHRHMECELNFVEHAPGVKRVVGDSVEVIGNYDLVLIGGSNLEHVWEQGECVSSDIRELTIHFSGNLFDGEMLSKNQFASIKQLLAKAEHGVAFDMDTIVRVYGILDTLASEQGRFLQFLKFLQLLYELSVSSGAKVLASSSFARADQTPESRRIRKVKEYISAHYREQISLEFMADMVGMSESGFSRFFRQHTGITLTDYILDIRLGHAARELVDSGKNISEISFESGFNNISNFNRIFKSKRGSTPREFRNLYKKNKVTV